MEIIIRIIFIKDVVDDNDDEEEMHVHLSAFLFSCKCNRDHTAKGETMR